jgi:hypothetical protein
MFQAELLDIAKLKSENFQRRYKAEYKDNLNEGFTYHTMKPIEDEMMSLDFDGT